MSDVVKITYGDETIFGHAYDALVDFQSLSMSAAGRSYHLEICNKNTVVANLDGAEFPQSSMSRIILTDALTRELISEYKKWLKSQDPVTLIMQQMGYYSLHEAAKKALGEGDGI